MSTEKYSHFEYGRMLAAKMKPFQNRFYKATEQTELEELNNAISEAKDTILIAVDGCESSFAWPDSDSLIEKPKYMFSVLSQTESLNTQTIFDAQQKCKLIAKQIIAKMLQDAKKYKAGLNFIDGSSFVIEGVGPIGDNFYGVILSFSFTHGISYKLDKSMWEE